MTLQDIAEGAWHAHVRGAAGPLGFRLPNGTLAPAWAEKTLAGATAAVVALGISAAVALGARRGGEAPITRETASGQAVGAPDGESALIDPLDEIDFEDGTPIVIGDPATGSGGDDPAPAPPSSSGAPSATPRGGGFPAPTGSGPSSTPTTTPPPSSPPTTTPPDDPDDPDDPGDGTTDPVTDLLDGCTNLGPVDDLTGCDDTSEQSTLPTLPSLPALPGLGG
jgi:hypothetical protein